MCVGAVSVCKTKFIALGRKYLKGGNVALNQLT